MDRIEAFVREAIRKHWPRGVEATDVRVTLSRDGSIILVIELPQPLPVLLLQLAAQRSPRLLEAVPGLLCCCVLPCARAARELGRVAPSRQLDSQRHLRCRSSP